MTDYSFMADDGKVIYSSKWETENPKGIVQIIHGMSEHVGRYDEFARYLNSRGYLVAGEDHRGHGKTSGDPDRLGYFADSDGWNRVIKDNVILGQRLKAENQDLPFYIIGESMGSFILRKLIVDYPEGIDKIILLSGGDLPNLQVYALSVLVKILGIFFSKKSKSRLMDKLSYSKLNDQFAPGKTGFEWITRDEHEIEKFIADPFCGFISTIGFYDDFAYGMRYLKKDIAYKKMPKYVPILFYSGDKDPLGHNGEYINEIAERYIKFGCTKVEEKFNVGGHHASLHEINRDEVFKTLADWLDL